METIKPSEKLPRNNQYVLAFFPNRPWEDGDAKNDEHKWVVVKFTRGISKKERELLADNNERKRTYYGEDEGMNNEKPYYWNTFGPGSFFGQEAEFWCFLPNT